MASAAWERLATFLADRGLSVDPTIPPTRCAGGLANENWIVFLAGGERVVVRRAPPGELPPGAYDRAREHRVLSRLAVVYPLAPRSLAVCDDAGVLGVPFVVLEHRAGMALHHGDDRAASLNPAEADALAGATIDALVRLHAIDPREVGLGELGRPSGFVERTARRWIERAEDRPVDESTASARDHVARWLTASQPRDEQPVLVHNDAKIDNFLFEETTLRPTALLDWDQCTQGAAQLDLAMYLVYWVEPGDPVEAEVIEVVPRRCTRTVSRADLVERYVRGTGRPVDDLLWFRVLATFKVAVVFHHQLPETVGDRERAGTLRGLGRALFVVAHDLVAASGPAA
jgi:aminoglycoside phosphotransferase (APT) family kinase protein